jgi:hypothetical protein
MRLELVSPVIPKIPEISKLLTIKTLATTTGLSEASIRWHLRHKRLRHIRMGRKILFDPQVILKDLQRLSK